MFKILTKNCLFIKRLKLTIKNSNYTFRKIECNNKRSLRIIGLRVFLKLIN